MRWLARRLSTFTEDDYREIVREGHFPEELNQLLYAKLLYRSSNLFELVGIQPVRKLALPSLNINSSGGLVVDGKVMKEFVPGYPERFSHGDRETPFKDGDFERYLGVRAKSSVIASVTWSLSGCIAPANSEARLDSRFRSAAGDRSAKNRRWTGSRDMTYSIVFPLCSIRCPSRVKGLGRRRQVRHASLRHR